ncbi:MAG: inorganic pyrophosphatase [Candidatus Binatia bacterium]|nr:inorganic pyrophosphatase [Candidatus Binatia bacterium]
MPYLYRRHPWHGIPIGDEAPERITAFIEIVPTDTVKYELDKRTGFLKVDRPQKFSNVYPSLYGFIPQTYCGDETGAYCASRTGRDRVEGDGDPLDICVLSERDISHGDILCQAIPIGGLRMIDGKEADDKIIAVLEGDAVYGHWLDIEESPHELVERLQHYFLTYKQVPGEGEAEVEITDVYGREEAHEVIRRSQRDYENSYGHIKAAKARLARL